MNAPEQGEIGEENGHKPVPGRGGEVGRILAHTREKHPEWKTIVDTYPPEIIAAIDAAGLNWLLIPPPKNADSMIWLWEDFISSSEGHPRNRELRKTAYDYPASYDDDHNAFYNGGRPCTGRIMLAGQPMFTRFFSSEIRLFQRLIGILNRLGTSIYDVTDTSKIYNYSMSAVE